MPWECECKNMIRFWLACLLVAVNAVTWFAGTLVLVFVGPRETSAHLEGRSAPSLGLTECPGTFVCTVHTVHVRLKFILYHNKPVVILYMDSSSVQMRPHFAHLTANSQYALKKRNCFTFNCLHRQD